MIRHTPYKVNKGDIAYNDRSSQWRAFKERDACLQYSWADRMTCWNQDDKKERKGKHEENWWKPCSSTYSNCSWWRWEQHRRFGVAICFRKVSWCHSQEETTTTRLFEFKEALIRCWHGGNPGWCTYQQRLPFIQCFFRLPNLHNQTSWLHGQNEIQERSYWRRQKVNIGDFEGSQTSKLWLICRRFLTERRLSIITIPQPTGLSSETDATLHTQ